MPSQNSYRLVASLSLERRTNQQTNFIYYLVVYVVIWIGSKFKIKDEKTDTYTLLTFRTNARDILSLLHAIKIQANNNNAETIEAKCSLYAILSTGDLQLNTSPESAQRRFGTGRWPRGGSVWESHGEGYLILFAVAQTLPTQIPRNLFQRSLSYAYFWYPLHNAQLGKQLYNEVHWNTE